MASPLIVFDIDGTLTRSIPVDDDCYLQAVDEVFGIRGVEPDWSGYPHSTDRGIAAEIVRRRLGRDVPPDEMAAFRRRFVALIAERLADDPAACPPVPGAPELVATLDAGAVAVATGGFSDSARSKLAAAGLSIVAGWPFASGDDAVDRISIIEMARIRAGARRPTVYVGDGVWDYHAARALGIGFVGIASGARAASLRAAGARRILPDFTDVAALWTALAEESHPQRFDATNGEV